MIQFQRKDTYFFVNGNDYEWKRKGERPFKTLSEGVVDDDTSYIRKVSESTSGTCYYKIASSFQKKSLINDFYCIALVTIPSLNMTMKSLL